MRILHVNDLPLGKGTGGVEIYLQRVIGAQRAAGHEVGVFAQEAPHQGPARLLDLWDPASAGRLRDRIGSEAPDIVHFHNVLRELSPSVLGATVGVPAVATIHDLRPFGGIEHHLPDPRAVVDRLVAGPLVRRGLRRHVAVLVAVSEAVRRHVEGYGFSNAVVVRVPVPPPAVEPAPVEQCHDVVFVGRVSSDKGAHVAVAAFERLASRHPESRLVIVGDGPERTRLEARTAGTGRVVFTGHLDYEGVSAALGKARVVVTPSLPGLRREGSPMSTVEAARHGRPVVSSDDPGLAEVTAIVGGDVVAAGDADALACAVDRWLGDPEAAAVAGTRAREAATRSFDVDRIRRGLDDVYRSVVGGG
ncbi:MAG: glycosyltransferase family 4 protein [Acidimicrobiales bacterium]